KQQRKQFEAERWARVEPYILTAARWARLVAEHLAAFFSHRLARTLYVTGHRLTQRESELFGAKVGPAADAERPAILGALKALDEEAWVRMAGWFRDPDPVPPEPLLRAGESAARVLVKLLSEHGVRASEKTAHDHPFRADAWAGITPPDGKWAPDLREK